MTIGFERLTEADSAVLWTIYCEHTPGQCGWCRNGWCAELGDTLRKLAQAGEYDWDPLRDGPLARRWP